VAGPFVTRCADEVLNGCVTATFALVGNPASRSVDGAWVVEEPKDGATRMKPVRGFPAATRLIAVAERERAVYVLLETLATGQQPAGLRGVVVLDEEASLNWPTSLATYPASSGPGQAGEEGARGAAHETALAAALEAAVDAPVVQPYALDLLVHAQEQHTMPAAQIERWVAPQGLSVEEVHQGFFSRRTEVISPGTISRWEGLPGLQRAVLGGTMSDCIHSAPGRCSLQDAGAGVELRMGGSDEKPTLRAWLRDAGPAGTERAAHAAPRRIEATGTSKPMLALLSRSPIELRAAAQAPLAEGGLIAVGAASQLRGPVLAVVDDEGHGAIHELAEAAEAGFDQAKSRLEVGFLDANADGVTDVLVRFERPAGGPWTGVYLVSRPTLARTLSRPGAPLLSSALSFWGAESPSVEAAVAAVLASPRAPVSSTEAARIIKASRTSKGFRAHSTPGAVVFGFKGLDPGLDRPWHKGRAELTDDDVGWMPDGDDFLACWSLYCSKEIPHCHCQLHAGSGYHQFWFTREGSVTKLAGVGRHLD
jgi:hypothetical protein